jgi:hypothetical protein
MLRVIGQGAGALEQLWTATAVRVGMRGLIVAGVLIALAVGARGAPAAAATRRDCGPRSAHTIARDRQVRVYRTTLGGYYACSLRNGKHTNVGSAHLELRGRYVSYVERSCDAVSGCSFELLVVDVPAARYLASSDSAASRVLKTVATSHGEAAALAETQDKRERFLLKLDWMGTSEVDRGPDLRALTLRARTLHWLNGDEAREAPAAHVRRCGPRRSFEALALTDSVRVYSVSRTPGDEEYLDYYACVRPGRKPLRLVRVDASPDNHAAGEVVDITVAGRIVAFTVGNCSGCDSTITVTDVGARRRVRTASVRGYLGSIVVSPRGLAAGIAYGLGPQDDAVVAFDSRGPTELDHGQDLHDLTLDGTTLSWFNGSERRSAELAGP